MKAKVRPNSAVIGGAIAFAMFFAPVGALLLLLGLNSAEVTIDALGSAAAGIVCLLVVIRAIFVAIRSGVYVSDHEVRIVGWAPAGRLPRAGLRVESRTTPGGPVRGKAMTGGTKRNLGVLAPLHGHSAVQCGYCKESMQLLAELATYATPAPSADALEGPDP